MQGLEGSANKWHIHNFPVDGACSSTGGHFDPLGAEVNGYSTCAGDAAAKATGCYVGDLSGKFGALGASASCRPLRITYHDVEADETDVVTEAVVWLERMSWASISPSERRSSSR